MEKRYLDLMNRAFVWKAVNAVKRVLRKEGERYDERNIVSIVKW